MSDMMKSFTPMALPSVLAATTLSGTVVLACMMPFAAIATIAALAMPPRRGLIAVMLCWLGNQVLGFGLMGFPWDGPTLAAGLSLLAASLIAFLAARFVAARGGALATFLAAFAAFELSLFVYALAFGDPALFVPQIVAQIALNEALWFAGLWLGWQVLARIPALADGRRIV
ncbi:MAG: hypothetical protein GW858_13170 [Sphingomonadales bacterium]|nr:hypothetical protein [Sphingomonadales bacterium]NCQ21572.1 hypothetical protein [Sphingomonadales bacterium]NCT04358.1 hypothetical protein [Sphingomonadales bacterium]